MLLAQESSNMAVRWRAIGWGLYYLVGMVILLKLVEGIIFSTLPYDSRGVGRFLSHKEIMVQGYTRIMLLGYMVVHTIKIAVPSYLAAQVAQSNGVLHAFIVIAIGTAVNWILFQAIVYSPASEIVGLAYSLLVAYIAASFYATKHPPIQ